MTATTMRSTALTVDTAVEGFSVLQTLAQIADAGWGGEFICLITKAGLFLGCTIGIVEYLDRLGVGTSRLANDLESGPRENPQHLHLCNTQESDGPAPTRLHRVRITDVEYCLIHQRLLWDQDRGDQRFVGYAP